MKQMETLRLCPALFIRRHQDQSSSKGLPAGGNPQSFPLRRQPSNLNLPASLVPSIPSLIDYAFNPLQLALPNAKKTGNRKQTATLSKRHRYIEMLPSLKSLPSLEELHQIFDAQLLALAHRPGRQCIFGHSSLDVLRRVDQPAPSQREQNQSSSDDLCRDKREGGDVDDGFLIVPRGAACARISGVFWSWANAASDFAPVFL